MTDSIYLALDFPDWNEAYEFIHTNHLHGVPVKVGMELFYKEGLAVIEKLKENNHKIFLDLKLHDIPTTVRKAMTVLSSLEVDMINVHALGGSEMILRAKEGLEKGNTKLIAVTVLTSMEQSVLSEELKIQDSLMDTVVQLSDLAKRSGADGVVCSVHEVEKIKQICGKEFLTVTPGIRLLNTDMNDQKRIATPSYARQTGSDFLVIGRSITASNNPRKAYEQAVREWEETTCNLTVN
ncbi:orotidine-5'-phosphate decarboxylase [Ornithinibacillus californiensis]|uniref:orotidine-5'-phosphate decarboxylase n=1 Tax=Ornithinibacillus californiensis TaxID=161536 RepID=UPI00064DF4F3|nr:orotidine-5'-phosphate decarboxylase [Ornithinibacillus californiensis]